MKENKTLKDNAITNYNAAKVLRAQMKVSGEDENYFNLIGYHLQQSVEMWIKHALEMNGVNYPLVHNITQLSILAEQNNVELGLSEYILDHTEMFTEWESRSRYVMGYSIEERKIDRAISELGECFDRDRQLIAEQANISGKEKALETARPTAHKKERLFGPGGRVERARAKADELNKPAREQKATDRDDPSL